MQHTTYGMYVRWTAPMSMASIPWQADGIHFLSLPSALCLSSHLARPISLPPFKESFSNAQYVLTILYPVRRAVGAGRRCY